MLKKYHLYRYLIFKLHFEFSMEAWSYHKRRQSRLVLAESQLSLLQGSQMNKNSGLNNMADGKITIVNPFYPTFPGMTDM